MNTTPNEIGEHSRRLVHISRWITIVSLIANGCLELDPNFVQPVLSTGTDSGEFDSSVPSQTNSTNINSDSSGDGIDTRETGDFTEDEDSSESTTTSSTTSSPKTSDSQPNDDFGGTGTGGNDDSGELTDDSDADQETSSDTSTGSTESGDSTTTGSTSTSEESSDTGTDSSTTDDSGSTTGSDTGSTSDSGDSTDTGSSTDSGGSDTGTDSGSSDTGAEPCVPEICFSLNASQPLNGNPWAHSYLYGYAWTAPETQYVVRAEVPTGEVTGSTNFWIYSDYNNGQRPGNSLGGNSWVVQSQVSWQGTDFSPSIPVVGGTRYWLVWDPPANAQAPVALTGQSNPYTWSSNGGFTWSGSQGRSMFRLYCCDTPE